MNISMSYWNEEMDGIMKQSFVKWDVIFTRLSVIFTLRYQFNCHSVFIKLLLVINRSKIYIILSKT